VYADSNVDTIQKNANQRKRILFKNRSLLVNANRLAGWLTFCYSGFQLSATEIRYMGAQPTLKVRRALGRVSRLRLHATAICYKMAREWNYGSFAVWSY
jgi:hypothetical protein